MKKEWKAPELEVLNVDQTFLDPNNGNHLDHAYPEGTPRNQLTWS
ncbi:paeninodin family lasso peptide [Paenibacillus aurantius]|uniref:Paeninodin family lasso peptide n=1 Tax=Paenibacillus aurantius TaxID=2918900 RepID=A0AA96LGN4_9BACL|nr:paeninodin family lasso peptide [Paenibacillus aurantius]WNQ12678.1 paeninodin family lasso peptide [Paenibacillus aurantius]